jgi:riboflavin synthase
LFTGLIETVGEIERVTQTAVGRELRIRSTFAALAAGESIAVNGACLTVREFGQGWFDVAAVTTTLERTNIGSWSAGTRVNLERAMLATDRLGGHIVQGHVDCVGRMTAREQVGDALLLDLSVPVELQTLFVPHGSITVDGVSLTVNELRPSGVQVSLIEYTLRHTTLGQLQPGNRVHVEVDVIAKQVRRILEPYLRGLAGIDSVRDFSLEH